MLVYSLMVILFLILFDIFVPLILGILFILISNQSENIVQYLSLFIIYGCTIIIFSFILDYYKDYYSAHFSEKIRIGFMLTIICILFQIFFLYYQNKDIDLLIIIFWLLIPICILLVRYLLKIKYEIINNNSIYIVGNLYKFNDSEVNMLIQKGFKIHFYDSTKIFLNKIISKIDYKKSIIVFNNDSDKLQNLKLSYPQLVKTINISLDEFMIKYLRKLYLKNNLFLDFQPYNRINYFLKRSIDYTAVIALSPILIISVIVVIIIKFKNNLRDSLIFTQKRCGMNKKIFSIYKIRTMYSSSSHESYTTKDDYRIYPFAKFLRELRIDEFPQIINILIGDMHLVGPRAEWVKLSDAYYQKIENYDLRHIVRPGITGWAQILYPYGRNEDDAEQKLMYDLYYIKNWSIWLEIEICFKTFFVMLDKRGF